jgi:hypothetical protein
MYGTLIRIGGDNPPRALIDFPNERVSCRVSTLDLARKIARRLYDTIGVTGTVTWDLRDMSVHDFRISELLEYEDTPPTQAFKSLSDLIGDYYEGVDVEKLIRDIRGVDEIE